MSSGKGPKAIRPPASANGFCQPIAGSRNFKASPAIAIIGVVDLTRKARQIAATTYEPLPPFLAAAVLYGLALLFLVIAARALERRLRVRLGRL